MRIKPKNPKVLRARRIIVGGVALAAVLFVLLRPNTDSSLSTEESAPMPETAATPVPEAEDAQGELNWQYPPAGVDYSDLPDKETLGDEEQPGLSNWRYLLVNGLSQENYLRENYYPDMVEIENGYFFQRRAADALKEFLAAARAQGFTVSISRTYMSYPDQRTRFNGMASTIYDRGEMSLADAEKKVTEMGYYPARTNTRRVSPSTSSVRTPRRNSPRLCWNGCASTARNTASSCAIPKVVRNIPAATRSPAISAMSARSPRNTSCARASRWRNSRTPTTRAKTTPGQRRTINE